MHILPAPWLWLWYVVHRNQMMIPVQKIMTTGHRAGRICTDLSNYKLFLKETFFGQPVVADFLNSNQHSLSLSIWPILQRCFCYALLDRVWDYASLYTSPKCFSKVLAIFSGKNAVLDNLAELGVQPTSLQNSEAFNLLKWIDIENWQIIPGRQKKRSTQGDTSALRLAGMDKLRAAPWGLWSRW